MLELTQPGRDCLELGGDSVEIVDAGSGVDEPVDDLAKDIPNFPRRPTVRVERLAVIT